MDEVLENPGESTGFLFSTTRFHVMTDKLTFKNVVTVAWYFVTYSVLVRRGSDNPRGLTPEGRTAHKIIEYNSPCGLKPIDSSSTSERPAKNVSADYFAPKTNCLGTPQCTDNHHLCANIALYTKHSSLTQKTTDACQLSH